MIGPFIKEYFMEPEELARELGISERTLHRWYTKRIGPPRISVGRNIFYHREDIRQWMHAVRRQYSGNKHEK